MSTLFCPECERRINLNARIRIGRRIVCSACQTNLEVINLNPLQLDVYQPDSVKMTKKRIEADAFCPECDHPLKLGSRPRVGQQTICLGCQTIVEVVQLNPLELEPYLGHWRKKTAKTDEEKLYSRVLK
jgi:hypothetical protein